MSEIKSLVTIITIAYNAFNSIEKTIKSVIAQTYPNIEYIIIDGGSNDGTINIIKNYDTYIDRWISEPDAGIYDAMNKGIAMANGEWINFMNSGDIFSHKKVVLNVMQKKQNNTEIIYGDVYKKYFDKNVLHKPISLDFFWKSIPFCHQSTFVKTELHKCMPFELKYKISSVYDFFYKCYTKGYTFYYINEAFCYYDMEGISSYSFLWLKDYVRISMKYSKNNRIFVFFRIFRLIFSRIKLLMLKKLNTYIA